MYTIHCFIYLIREMPELNHYALCIKEGNVSLFDEIDKVMRPKIRKMTYKHTSDMYQREDLEQSMMEYILMLCYRYDATLGDFHNYSLRSAYFELKKNSKRYYITKEMETSGDDMFEYLFDKRESYETKHEILLKDTYRSMIQDTKHFSEYERSVMRYLGKNMTIEEIATHLNKDRKSVQNTLYRILRKNKHTYDVY